MIELVYGDLLQQDVDAIVNPANSYMLHGGGLARIIINAAGTDVVHASQQWVKDHGPVKTGESIITTAGELPFKGIIHTVGPAWGSDDTAPYWRRNSSDENPDQLLCSAYVSALNRAREADCRSIAFPAISCGVFRFPVERAAPIAVAALRDPDPSIERILICVMDDSHYRAFDEALA